MHTSYTDVLDLAYVDRIYLMENIKAKHDATAKAVEEVRQKRNAKKTK